MVGFQRSIGCDCCADWQDAEPNQNETEIKRDDPDTRLPRRPCESKGPMLAVGTR